MFCRGKSSQALKALFDTIYDWRRLKKNYMVLQMLSNQVILIVMHKNLWAMIVLV
jgi:hypothetical protein